MFTIKPHEMLNARVKLGDMWGLGRQLTLGEMGHLVGLKQASGSDTIMQIESGKREASGPVSLVIRAMLDGWEPPTKADALKETRASTSPRGPHGMDTRAPAAGKLANRPIIGARTGTTWAGDPRREGEGDGEE